MRQLLVLALGSALGLSSLATAQAQADPSPPRNSVAQIANLDWIALLTDPATRRLIASFVRNVVPDNLRARVSEDQIDEALAIVVAEIRDLPGVPHGDEKLLQAVKKLGEKLWPEEASRVENQVQSAISSVREYIAFENGKYVVNFERAGSLRVLYEERRFRGPSTIFKPIHNERRGFILVSGRKIKLTLDGSKFDGEGDLILRDQIGSFTADTLKFDDSTGDFSSDRLKLRLPSLQVDGGHASTNLKDVDMKDLHLKATLAKLPILSMKAATLATEGDWGTATNFQVNLLGIRVYHRDYWKFPVTRLDNNDPMPSLVERLRKLTTFATYLKPPVIDLFGRAPALSYSNTITFGNQQQVDIGLRAQRGQYFASHGRFSVNLLKDEKSNPNVMGKTALISNFAGGYVQNPGVRSIGNYVQSFRRPRLTGILDFAFNQRVELRGIEDIESTPFGVGIEVGGPIGKFGGVGQIRYEQAKVVKQRSENRFVALASIGLFYWNFAPGLSFNGRVDGAAFKPKGDGYAWVRPVATLQARILPQIYVSGSYVNGTEFGPSFMLGDRYLAGPEYHARLDLNFGATQISYANRYSVRQKAWYRSQLYVAQDVDAFQLFVLSDQSLGRFSFGAHFRLEEILTSLRARRYRGVAFDPPVPVKL